MLFQKVQKLKDPNSLALGCDALWNTFWNLNQFWNLVTPEWSSKWVKSQLAMYDANGWLAKGPAGMNYVPVMVCQSMRSRLLWVPIRWESVILMRKRHLRP